MSAGLCLALDGLVSHLVASVTSVIYCIDSSMGVGDGLPVRSAKGHIKSASISTAGRAEHPALETPIDPLRQR